MDAVSSNARFVYQRAVKHVGLAQGQNLSMTSTGIAETGDIGSLSRLLPKVILVDVISMQAVGITEVVSDVHRPLIDVYVGTRGAEKCGRAVNGSVGRGYESKQGLCDTVGTGLYLSSACVTKDIARS